MVAPPLRKRWVWVLIILAAGFLGLQFARPIPDNPPVTADLKAPEDIKQILKTACYNCHSNETKLAWFDQLAPASWLVARDIQEARKRFNFSEWDSLTKDQQKAKLFEALFMMENKAMPLKQYTLLHPGARIGPEQITRMKTYLTSLYPMLSLDTAKTRAWDEQYTGWVNGTIPPHDIKAAPNGIAFIPEYKDWAAISSSERLDNGTMRVIMGNEVAVNAIKTRHINPWPDGTTFAKIAWAQVIDSTGNIHAGEFKQVEFMIKDKSKYAATEGWGFARWVKGTQLVPYGKNTLFTTECTTCHQPMQKNDFVFTMPPDTPDTLALNPLEWKVIASSVNKGTGTMSTLYGNGIAVRSARTDPSHKYPSGSVLSLVTWVQKEDKHWFGAHIPGSIQSVEEVRLSDTANGKPPIAYDRYEGSPLKKGTGDPRIMADRVAYMLSQRASVMP